MNSFFKFFAERHLLAILITTMILLLGLSTIPRTQRDIFPNVDFSEMIITAVYPGASPEDVELNVTNKIEEELQGVTGIEHYSSFSMENYAFIDVILDPDAKDQDKIQAEIREAVNRITDLPQEVTESPLVLELNSGIFPILEVGISGDLPYRDLREIARRFERQLEIIPGVSNLVRFGYLAREIKVEVSPNALQKYQIPLRNIIAAIRSRNIRSTAGSFESYKSERSLVTLAEFRDPLEVKNVIVRSTFEGPSVRVKDIAIVRDDFEEPRVLSRLNGKQAISFMINKKEDADIIRTVDAIKELIEREKKFLPEGVEILYSSDISYYVRNRLNVVRNNGLIGLSLVIFLLAVFLSLRTAFWVSLGIPVALMGVLFLLPVFDSSLNVIALAGMIMVIGIIVDDAIIISENIQRKLELGDTPIVAAVQGIREVFPPVLTTILTTFLAFAPMFFMSGIIGKFVFVIPLVMSLALFVSLGEATFALPAHLITGIRNPQGSRSRISSRKWFDFLRDRYKRIIYLFLKVRYVFIVFSIFLLLGSIWYTRNYMKFVLFHDKVADTFFILVELPPGSSLEATSDKVKEIEALVDVLPEEELYSYTTRIGNQGMLTPGESENWAIVTVGLSPFSKRTRTAEEIIEDLRSHTDSLEDFTNIVYYIDAGPPVGRPITLRVVGSDDTLRKQLADSVETFLLTLDGVKDMDRNDKLGKEQVEVTINYDKLSRLGLTVSDVAQNLRIAYDGEVVTQVRYGDEDVDFRVMLQKKSRKRLTSLREIPIPNTQGRLIPLKDVAKLKIGAGPTSVYHYDGERAIRVTGDVTKGETTSLDATKAVQEHFNLPRDWSGMRFVIGGEAEQTQESMASLMRAFVVAVIGIYFLLILLFNSLTQPIMVMMAIPFGIIGVIFAFALHGETLGFLSVMGIVGLTGVVVNDSLVLVNHINKLKRQNPQEKTINLVAQGSADRLRAVLLTTLTTVAGLLPLAYGIGGSDSFIAPMALALGYGLLFATPLTLILVPSLYVIRDDIGRMFRIIERLFKRKEV
jgi:multidrug efflux pump subunit AcrB